MDELANGRDRVDMACDDDGFRDASGEGRRDTITVRVFFESRHQGEHWLMNRRSGNEEAFWLLIRRETTAFSALCGLTRDFGKSQSGMSIEWDNWWA
jgi:hypothetical protein